MLKYRQSLPNPSHLVTFEAAARHLSFTLAAAELNVTRVAVSLQMKALEEYLGVKLFNRLPQSLSLTSVGKQYRIAVSEALVSLYTATKEIRSKQTAPSVTVTSTAAVTTYWLMPRIGQFRKLHPEIDIRVLVAEQYLDLSAESIDVAVRYGENRWPDLDCKFLFHDEIIPVCSPGYFGQREPYRDPSKLLEEALIHLEGLFHSGHMWNHWFSEQGVDVISVPSSMQVNTYSNLVQAALNGQGISLLGAPLIHSYLQNGQLVIPCTAPVIPRQSRQTFYLATPKDRKPSGPAELFCRWLIAGTESTEAAAEPF